MLLPFQDLKGLLAEIFFKTSPLDLHDFRRHVIPQPGCLMRRLIPGKAKQHTRRKVIASTVGIDGMNGKTWNLHDNPFLDHVRTLFASRDKERGTQIGKIFKTPVQIGDFGKGLCLFSVHEHHVTEIPGKGMKILPVPIHQEGIAECKGSNGSQPPGLFQRPRACPAWLRCVPQISLDIGKTACGNPVHIQVRFCELRRNAKVRVHGPLGIWSRQDHAGAGGVPARVGMNVKMNACFQQIEAIEFPVQIPGHLSRVESCSTATGQTNHRIGRRTAGLEFEAASLERLQQRRLERGFNQGHRPFRQVVFPDKVLADEGQGVNEGVPHSKNVMRAAHPGQFSPEGRGGKKIEVDPLLLHSILFRVQLFPRRPGDLPAVLTTWTLAATGFLLLHRIIFLLFYLAQALQVELTERPGEAIILAFFTGLRFDLATLPLWIAPYLVLLSLLSLPVVIAGERWQRSYQTATSGLFYMQWLWILWLHLLALSSTYNFGVNGKHLGWEFAAYFKDLPVLVAGSFSKDPVATTLLAMFIPVWVLGGIGLDRLCTRRAMAQEGPPVRSSRTAALALPIVVLAFSVLLFRGGFQASPLRPGDAMDTGSPFLNSLKLNGVYTIAHDFYDQGDFKLYFPEQENVRVTRAMLDDGRPFLSDEYPLLRHMEGRRIVGHRFATLPGTAGNRRPNIVILVLESWSAKFLESHGYSPDVAPNFNRLQREGVFFRNFYASGGRSANGLFSILTGLPDRAGRTILRSSKIFSRFGGLPALLGRKGYQTIFVHGGDLHFDNLDAGLPHLGFHVLSGMKEIEATGRYPRRWTMGFHDEDTYDMLVRQIDASVQQDATRPFFAMAFSSNNHHPFGLPDPSFEFFPASDPEAAFKNSFRYSDFAIGKLIDTIQRRPYGRDTIVLLVADHTHHANLDYLQDREIPLLVYAPTLFSAEVRTDVAGQLDLLPTVLSLSGGDSDFAAMGRDLTAPPPASGHPFAFFAGGSNTDIIGVVRGNYIYFNYLRSQKSALLKATPPADFSDLKNEAPAVFTELNGLALHYYQFARTLEKENRVWPPDAGSEP